MKHNLIDISKFVPILSQINIKTFFCKIVKIIYQYHEQKNY